MKKTSLYHKIDDVFILFARKISQFMGSYWVFFLALLSIVLWVFTGSYYNYSDTWQLIINTVTTIITFLMVFIIQNTQNRDSESIELKLDELIKKSHASNKFIDIEELTEEEFEKLRKKFKK